MMGRKHMDETKGIHPQIMLGIIIALGIFAVIVLCLAYKQHMDDFWNRCEEKGGHVITSEGSNGYLCIDDDGRIIE